MKFAHILIIYSAIVLSACASPSSQVGGFSKEELRAERAAQQQAQRNATKVKVTRKSNDLNYYRRRIANIGPKLQQAAVALCKRGACNYEFIIHDKEELNAWADGNTVNITPIMIDFLANDRELALVLSHELAHNVMRHIPKQRTNAIIGTVVDIAVAATAKVDTRGTFGSIGARSYSQDFENEADYVGVYIMARAGYNVRGAHELWRKMSAQNPEGIKHTFFGTHPSYPERYLRMRKAEDEVIAKLKAGQELLPNKKK